MNLTERGGFNYSETWMYRADRAWYFYCEGTITLQTILPGFNAITHKRSKTPSALATDAPTACRVALVLERHKGKLLQVVQNAICLMLFPV